METDDLAIRAGEWNNIIYWGVLSTGIRYRAENCLSEKPVHKIAQQCVFVAIVVVLHDLHTF